MSVTISHPQLATFLIFFLCGLILVQAVGFLIFLWRFERKIGEVERDLKKISRVASSSLDQTHRLLSHLRWFTQKIPTIEEHATRMVEKVYAKSIEVDQTLENKIRLAGDKVESGSRRFEYALAQWQRQSSRVNHAFQAPVREVSALLHGLKVGLQTLRGGEDWDAPLNEEEKFI